MVEAVPVTRSAIRIQFLDYLRGFVIALVVLDHAMHAYCEHYAKWWFLPDFDRSVFFDVLHLHNDSFMMPCLFFIAGLFVLPSLKRRGVGSFIKERLLRLGLPFGAGVLLICPLLSYPKYILRESSSMDLWEYFTTVFLTTDMHAGPFWFLAYLGLLTLIALLLYYIFPSFYRALGKFCQWCIDSPLKGFTVVAFMSAIILGVSDLIWGAPWWINLAWGKLFYVRAARFLLKAFLFFLGIGFSQCGLLQNAAAWQRLADHWKQWALTAVAVGSIYILYTLMYFEEGVYNNDVRYFFYQGGEWEDLWPVFAASAPMVLARTTLLGVFILSQIMAYLAIFRRFLNHDSPSWQSLAVCSYGIYIIHEPFVVWTHWILQGSEVPILFRFLLAGFGSLFVSWAIVKQGLFKVPVLRRILS